ncbi:MAG: hypothetical protein Q9178_005772 [Gyalolechia marmorata]
MSLSTHNTAPVLSFNCLYTHDLRRKASNKRWQDGVLKFHTFNNRIMVYDVPRNFVGDTHWRGPQPIQDGDELELEKGVLIQVGEELEIERTETDLTELLEKRKPKHTSAELEGTLPARSATANTSTTSQVKSAAYNTSDRPNAAYNSQLRPKSLNTLLGRPRGPVGRATIPAKSPAEERRQKENGPPSIERSPKRRRIDHPTDSSPTASLSTNRHVDRFSGSGRSATTLNTACMLGKHTHNQAAEVASRRPPHPAISEPREDQPDNVVTNAKLRGRPERNQRDKNRSSDAIQTLDTTPSVHAKANENCWKPASDKRILAKVAPRGHEGASCPNEKAERRSDEPLQNQSPRREASSAQPENVQYEPRPENLLRIIPSKPRRKLMYRDLLSNRAPPQSGTPYMNDQGSGIRASERRPSHHPYMGPESTLTGFHQAQQDRLDSRLSKGRKVTEIIEDPSNQLGSLLRDDEGEYIYTPDKSPALNDTHNREASNSLFLSQPSSDKASSKASNLSVGQHEEPSEAEDTDKQSHLSPKEDRYKQLDKQEGSPSYRNGSNSTFPDSLFFVQSSVEEPPEQHPSRPSEKPPTQTIEPPNKPTESKIISSSTQPARRLSEMDSLPPQQHPSSNTKPQGPQKHDIIKAALPPQQISRPPNHLFPNRTARISRPFSRSISDIGARSSSTTTITYTKQRIPSLPKSLSNDFIPLQVAKPLPPPPIHIHSTNLYIGFNNGSDVMLDSRPGSAKEQTVEPWSREAFDLFGFEGVEKWVGTCNGVVAGGEKGEEIGMLRGEDGWLVASQGFV